MKLSAPVYQLKRRARLLARNENIALHVALDRIAREEGFSGWSLLSARLAARQDENGMLSRLSEGDMLVLGARPGQGKTRLGLQILLDAVRDGRRAVFFTLEYTERDVRDRIRALDPESQLGHALEIVTSDDICAEYIIARMSDAAGGSVAVIDYLQILDQQRSKPDLSEQIASLSAFASRSGVILAFISQVDRSYDPEGKRVPDMGDIRLPNRVDTRLFSKACFLHRGQVRFSAVA